MLMLLSEKTDLRQMNITRDEEGHFVTIKKSIHQQDITILNTNGPNNRISKYVKQTLTELH